MGSIIWNFADLTMSFLHKEKACLLQGIVLGRLHLMKGSQLSKCMCVEDNGPSPILFISHGDAELNVVSSYIPLDL